MPAAKKKPAPSKPRQERKERVVTANNGEKMRSTLAQMQNARTLPPLASPQRPALFQPRPKPTGRSQPQR